MAGMAGNFKRNDFFENVLKGMTDAEVLRSTRDYLWLLAEIGPEPGRDTHRPRAKMCRAECERRGLVLNSKPEDESAS